MTNYQVFYRFARFFAVVGVSVLLLHLLFTFIVGGVFEGLSQSNSTFGVEQTLGAVGSIVMALCSPVVASILLTQGLVFYLVGRSLSKENSPED